MKKAVGIILALTLVMSLAIPAAATVGTPAAASVSSPTATPEDLKPLVVETSSPNLEIMSAEEIEDLPEAKQEAYAEAMKSLEEDKDVVPEGMAVRYVFYCSVTEDGTTANEALSMTVELDGFKELVIKQFIDGKWVELEYVINEDGTITILNVVDGPMAIFVK